jgi:hypothetical protein
MPKLSYSPLGGVDAETAQDARFLPFLLTFLRVVRDLSTDEVKLMLLHYQQVPKGFHGSPPEDAVQIDSSPLIHHPMACANGPPPSFVHNYDIIARFAPMEPQSYGNRFHRVLDCCKKVACDLLAILASHEGACGALPLLPGLLAGIGARENGPAECHGHGFHAAIVINLTRSGTIALFHGIDQTPSLFVFEGDAQVVAVNHTTSILGLCLFTYSDRACRLCKRFLTKKQTRHCARCGEIYCSRECQVEHWAAHKASCERPASGP